MAILIFKTLALRFTQLANSHTYQGWIQLIINHLLNAFHVQSPLLNAVRL